MAMQLKLVNQLNTGQPIKYLSSETVYKDIAIPLEDHSVQNK